MYEIWTFADFARRTSSLTERATHLASVKDQGAIFEAAREARYGKLAAMHTGGNHGTALLSQSPLFNLDHNAPIGRAVSNRWFCLGH